MSFADFTLSDLVEKFLLTLDEQSNLYALTPPAAVRPDFLSYLADAMSIGLRISNEKARSEFIIVPILMEVWLLADRGIGLHSGVDLTVDPANGLSGTCDYIITRSPGQLFVKSPIIAVVEAKNEDYKRGYAQCIAEMLAARQFNAQKGSPESRMFGAVTIGDVWKFLELEGSTVKIDSIVYYIEDLAKILGILLHMATD